MVLSPLKRFMNVLRRKVWRASLAKALATGRVKVGANLQLNCPFFFQGPGRLVIGDNVVIGPSFWSADRITTIATRTSHAVVTVGNDVVLEGTRIGCQTSITIGDRCMIGEASIMDTDFHGLDPDQRFSDQMTRTEPVMLAEDVKVASDSFILRGVTLGAGVVVRPKSVVTKSIPAGLTVSGYPARPMRPADQKSQS